MKKYSYGLISALNESFQEDIKTKRTKTLKESLESGDFVTKSDSEKMSKLKSDTPKCEDCGKPLSSKEIKSFGVSSLGLGQCSKCADNETINESAEESEELDKKEILNEDSYEFDKLVQGEDLFFRNSEGTALLGHYANNYPTVEEYDEGLLPENGATQEEYQDAKNAEQSGDVYEFLVVDENTLQPTSEVYTYIYGNNALYDFVTKQLRPVKVIKKLEESRTHRVLHKGDEFVNPNGVKCTITSVDNEHLLDGEPQVTYLIGRTYKCYKLSDVLGMLDQNRYKLLNEEAKPKKITKLIDTAKDTSSMVKEEDLVLVNATNAEPDYVITDVTELEDINLGDVQSPDIDAMLTMIQESIKDVYGPESIKIHIHSSNLLENGSFALVDITTPEILKEFEKINSKDTAVGKSLILENKSKGLYEFRVNNTSGTTRYLKRTKEPAKVIYEWLETEFLSEAKKAKEEEKKVHERTKLEDTINQFLNNNKELQLAIETVKMYIEAVGKEGKEAIKPMIEKIAVEFPVGVTTTDDSLTFDSRDNIIEILFGKEWIPSEPEEVEPSVPGTEVIKESENLTESYQQFNIGEIDVVYNPETQEVMYSIGADDTHDKKINLTKVPSVETPYNTETIIKNYIEKQYGPIPEEIENNTEEPEGEELPLSQEEPTQENMEDEVPMTEEDDEISQDAGLDQSEPNENEALEDSKAETGSAKFQKIKPNSGISVENIRTSELDGTVQADSAYIVVEEVELSDEDFNNFSSDLSKPQDFFTGVTPLDRKNYPFNVVKITNSNSSYDIIADPVGYNYRTLYCGY